MPARFRATSSPRRSTPRRQHPGERPSDPILVRRDGERSCGRGPARLKPAGAGRGDDLRILVQRASITEPCRLRTPPPARGGGLGRGQSCATPPGPLRGPTPPFRGGEKRRRKRLELSRIRPRPTLGAVVNNQKGGDPCLIVSRRGRRHPGTGSSTAWGHGLDGAEQASVGKARPRSTRKGRPDRPALLLL